MRNTITVSRDSADIEITDDTDVQTLFERDAGVEIGGYLEEWQVVTIDAEFDQVKNVGPVFRIYCYFEGVARAAAIGDEKLNIPHWTRVHNILDEDGTFGVVYELEPTN